MPTFNLNATFTRAASNVTMNPSQTNLISVGHQPSSVQTGISPMRNYNQAPHDYIQYFSPNEAGSHVLRPAPSYITSVAYAASTDRILKSIANHSSKRQVRRSLPITSIASRSYAVGAPVRIDAMEPVINAVPEVIQACEHTKGRKYQIEPIDLTDTAFLVEPTNEQNNATAKNADVMSTMTFYSDPSLYTANTFTPEKYQSVRSDRNCVQEKEISLSTSRPPIKFARRRKAPATAGRLQRRRLSIIIHK